MNKYKLINNISGWTVFLIAAITYLLTIEPSASYWDCGEFIATAFKLEVGHPPGAPLFMIMARFFSIFAPDNLSVAAYINSFSALSAAFTILFLFWTITHFAKKLVIKGSEITNNNIITIISAGIVGSLAYTFSDTFWFSAVEAEVYSSSSLFTALVFWAILKWEDVADKPYANRWIILIAYLMGLSIGVHLLNLLAIPAIVFVYYFRKYKPTKSGVLYAAITSLIILVSIMYGVIPGIVQIASKFELIFVNGLGLPFNSGIIAYAVLLISLIVYGLYYSLKKKKYLLNTILLSLTVIIIGYSSFTMIVIRSAANPPMDENNPDNVFALLSYLNREQYGDRPLFYGEYYNAPAIDSKKGSSTWIKKGDKYVESNIREKTIFDPRFETIFPRMFSRQPGHEGAYKQWAKIKGKQVIVDGEKIVVPTFGENIRFFFRYQLGHMYMRYFMWNFAGKQNDVQGYGGILNGNWISGIPFLDSLMLGNQSEITEDMKTAKSRNTYYLLPLFLGLTGLFFVYFRNKHDFWVIMLLFFFTGIAIVVYLNQSPYQPRERDYAYAGSFYAFAIWIGLGVLSISKWFTFFLRDKIGPVAAGLVCLLAVPVVMGFQNYDDHDRSNRYAAHDIGYNYLMSCDPNALLFTFGDNDTFPLWYLQEVEGVRTDVRIINMSLLSVDWYINQMKQQAYLSAPVPTTLKENQYEQGNRDQVFVFERFKDYTDIKQIMQFVGSDNPDTKVQVTPELKMDYIPSKKLRLTVDPDIVIANGTVPESMRDKIVNLDWTLNRSSVLKNELMMIDILAANNWERPVYFAISAATDSYIGLENYLRLDGFAYRLVPIETSNQDGSLGMVNPDILYDNLMNKFKWGNMQSEDFYMDEIIVRQLNITKARTTFARLGMQLIFENKLDSAIEVFDKCLEILPDRQVPFDQFALSFVRGYYMAGNTEKGNALARIIADRFIDELNYYYSLDKNFFNNVDREVNLSLEVLKIINQLAGQAGQVDLSADIQARMDKIQIRSKK